MSRKLLARTLQMQFCRALQEEFKFLINSSSLSFDNNNGDIFVVYIIPHSVYTSAYFSSFTETLLFGISFDMGIYDGDFCVTNFFARSLH